ncbi:protein kinase domain-containing protein [Blastococcus saxobsidens]|uniref:protein kinase domain-containing protein n=1 Tax=Blastococcus saxobsidens TaxID=138336 RepID=UPI00030BBA69|nr:protein kinase [Blastococcus saxobsidens]
MVEPGRRCLGDRYELDRLIAAGGMGQVWRAVDAALHRPVAVKILRSEYTGDPTFVARFRAEAQHAAALSHPHIAAVFDYGEETAGNGSGETLAYLVMELVEGEPLSALLRREGALDPETTLSVLHQTAAALAEAHLVGMVHRDVKPGNILVRPDGTVKITDFGIAWSARSVALTRTGQVIGTPQYLSPEQAEGRHATPASDVYALGLIGYECLTGHPAFEGDNAVTIALKQIREEPEPLPAELPSDVRTLIGRALVKDPGARIPDGAGFAAAIADVQEGREPAPGGAAQARRPGGSWRPAGSRPARAAVERGVARPPVARRRSRLTVVLMPLLGLLAGAGITAAALQSLSQETPSSTAAAAEERTSGTIVLASEDYVGQPVGEVAERLAALGLTVAVRAEVRDDVVPDRVISVVPADRPLRSGDRVVVHYAAAQHREEPRRGTAVTGAAVDRVAPPSTQPTEPPAPSTTTPPAPTAPTTTAPATTPSLPASTSAPTSTSSAPSTTSSTSTPTETSTPTSTSTASETASSPSTTTATTQPPAP